MIIERLLNADHFVHGYKQVMQLQCELWLKHMNASYSDLDEMYRLFNNQDLMDEIRQTEEYTRKVAERLRNYIKMIYLQSEPILKNNSYSMVGGFMKSRINYLKGLEPCMIL